MAITWALPKLECVCVGDFLAHGVQAALPALASPLLPPCGRRLLQSGPDHLETTSTSFPPFPWPPKTNIVFLLHWVLKIEDKSDRKSLELRIRGKIFTGREQLNKNIRSYRKFDEKLYWERRWGQQGYCRSLLLTLHKHCLGSPFFQQRAQIKPQSKPHRLKKYIKIQEQVKIFLPFYCNFNIIPSPSSNRSKPQKN